ncbi:MAG: GNAT family N-acetyltransferase [Thermosipho sp. (in: Bacteria)]|nr:GNAT family N-acetyltransferase [Thermosipho sp. (in: thermotogales)]
MSIEIINDKQEWDMFVDSSYNGILFHKWDFLKIVEKHANAKLVTYGIHKGDALIALFPVFIMKKGFLKFIFTSSPKAMMTYSGVILSKDFGELKQNKKEGIMEEIVNSMNQILAEISPDFFYMILTPGIDDIREFKWNKYEISPLYTYVLDLTKTLDEIWSGLKKVTRKNIKKAENNANITIEKVESADIIYNFLKDRYAEQGLHLPILSNNYLNELISAYPENIEAYVLKNIDGEVLTGKLIIKYKDRYINWIGDMKTENASLQDYIMWKFIEKAKTEGYHVFDFGGANTKRLCKFKAKFNPRPELYFGVTRKNLVGKVSEWIYNLVYK